MLRQRSRESYWGRQRRYPLQRPDIDIRARGHHLRHRHVRDPAARRPWASQWGDRPDHGCNPACALKPRTSRESATSLAGHASYARLVAPQALNQAGTESPLKAGQIRRNGSVAALIPVAVYLDLNRQAERGMGILPRPRYDSREIVIEIV
jgi:hypothetical protein